MIIGTGIDIVDIARFERTVSRTPRLLERLFTPTERPMRLRSLAARYAAKEALIKALGGSDGVHWSEIEIASEASGRPYFVLTGTTAEAVRDKGATATHLTMSHDAGLAIAYVILEAPGTPGVHGTPEIPGMTGATHMPDAPGTPEEPGTGEAPAPTASPSTPEAGRA